MSPWQVWATSTPPASLRGKLSGPGSRKTRSRGGGREGRFGIDLDKAGIEAINRALYSATGPGASSHLDTVLSCGTLLFEVLKVRAVLVPASTVCNSSSCLHQKLETWPPSRHSVVMPERESEGQHVSLELGRPFERATYLQTPPHTPRLSLTPFSRATALTWSASCVSQNFLDRIEERRR